MARPKRFDSNNLNNEQDSLNKINKNTLKSITILYKYINPYKWYFIIGILFLLLSTATSLSFPYITGKLIDSATGKSAFTIKQITYALFIVLIFQALFSFMRVWLFSNFTERSISELRKAVYGKFMSLHLPFFEKNRVGELISRLSNDISQLSETLSITLAEFFRQIATLLVGIIIIASTSLKLTLLMLATFPVGIIAAIVFGKYIRQMSRKTQDALAKSGIIVEETLQNIQTVKAFTNESFEHLRYTNSINKVMSLAINSAKYRAFFITFIISVLFGGIILVLWYGANLIQNGSMSVGELTTFIIYTFFIGAAVGGLGDMYANLQRTAGATERIQQILAENTEIELNAPYNKQPINGNISYKNVYFNYPTRPDVGVLQNISLEIKQGQKIALIGASGAGKSTIIQLLLRFYSLDSGEINIDNKNIEAYDIRHLRSNIGIVPQDVILFGGSIRENICYGKPDASDAEIIEAVKKANAFEFVESFPEGLNTIVGERGIKLSGGQRQRIAIARAILKNPSILILDEATSSLDAESEYLVQQALNELMKNRTTIIIAHRLSTIKKVDTIYCIDKGIIAESGIPSQLALKENGIYANLLKLQTETV